FCSLHCRRDSECRWSKRWLVVHRSSHRRHHVSLKSPATLLSSSTPSSPTRSHPESSSISTTKPTDSRKLPPASAMRNVLIGNTQPKQCSIYTNRSSPNPRQLNANRTFCSATFLPPNTNLNTFTH